MYKPILIMIFASICLYGQDKGVISGAVTDKITGEPLVGVNVMIKGTYYGASTGLDGHYFIKNVNNGTFGIEASIIGYKVVLQTGIKVKYGQKTTVNFTMEETVLTIGEEVIVLGAKPLFDVDETASVTRVTSDDIANKTVNSVEDILAEQVGVTKQDNEIHIRGGRIDESLFIVDGMSVKDPLSGYSGNLYITAEAVQNLEIITGGYNAEYGQAMSGVVNIKLKEGRDTFEGAIKFTSDNWGLSTDNIEHYKTDRFEFNLGGPMQILELLLPKFGVNFPGKFSFFINGYGKMYDSNLPIASKLYPHRNWEPIFGMTEKTADGIMDALASRENNDWHFLYKLSWELSPKKKMGVSYDVSLNVNQGYFMPRAYSHTYYPYRYEKILDNYNTITRESRLVKMNWTHTLSTRSFYEIVFGRFLTLEHSAVQDLHWTEYEETLDLEPINYTISDKDGNIDITYGDEFYDTGFAPEWYDIVSDNYRLDADWVYHTKNRHKIKTGMENTVTEMQVLDINAPWLGDSTSLGANYDMYNAQTMFGAFYIQDQIKFKGMTMNLGMRYDYWFPGKYVEDAIDDTNMVIITDAARDKFNDDTFAFLGYRGKGRLSPRFGISHPMTDNDVLYFYYGHFSQLPTFQYVYAKLNSIALSTYQIFGNPNLSSKTTVQYELGIKHRFSDDQVLEVKAYWKDMFDYETSQTISISDPVYDRIEFDMYFNADYARARGVEIILKSRIFTNWYADVNFNYSIVTGKSSSPHDNQLVHAGVLTEKTLGENFMSWDRPFQFFSNLYYNHPSDWGASLRFEFGSTRRYTRSIPTGTIEDDGVNYYIGPYEGDKPYYYFGDYNPKIFRMLGLTDISGYSTVDLKLHKTFNFGGLKYKLFIEIENLFDEETPRRFNSFTGKGYNPGEIIPYSMITRPNPNYDPSRIKEPRTTKLGVQILF